MNKYRITNPNNNIVREYKFRTTEKLIVLLIVALFFYQCSSNKKYTKVKCEEYNEKSYEFLNSFFIDNDTLLLDSSSFYVYQAINNCEEYNKIIIFRELTILSLKHDYDKALLFIDKYVWEMDELPYYKSVLKKRFRAMELQSKGNMIERNKYLKSAVTEIDEFIVLNKTKVESLFKKDIKDILINPLHMAIIQNYYYKSLLYGSESIKKELDSIQKSDDTNKDFIEMLKDFMDEDFMVFNGY